MTDKFWLSDPYILLNKDKIFNLLPSSKNTTNENLNSITRLIIIIAIVGFSFTQSQKILISLFVSMVSILVYHKYINNKKGNTKTKLKEAFSNQESYKEELKNIKKEFTTPNKTNPMMNVMIPEIHKKPTRKQALPSFAPSVEKDINEKVKENLDPRLFKDLGDNIVFDQSMRNFYTMPNTEVMNDQKGFAEFCYGNMPSCKEGDGMQCDKKNYRFINP